jgi:hypothetical protein
MLKHSVTVVLYMTERTAHQDSPTLLQILHRMQILSMVRFSKEYAAAQNDAYKRIVLENSGMLVAETEEQEAQLNREQLREWWSKSFSTFHQVCTVLHDNTVQFQTFPAACLFALRLIKSFLSCVLPYLFSVASLRLFFFLSCCACMQAVSVTTLLEW